MLLDPTALQSARRTLTLLLALLMTGTLQAAQMDAEEDEHPRVTVNPALALAAVLDATTARHPRARMRDARLDQAEAWNRFSQGWLAGAPTASLRYQSDRLWSNDGLEEWESGFDLPLWRWGQRTRVRDYSNELATLAGASDHALRWDLAGELRETFWSIALAQSRVTLAEQELQSDQVLLQLVEKRFASGESPRSELLLAQTVHLEARSALLSAKAGLIDQEWRYQSLTGLTRCPEFTPEAQNPATQVPDDHPVLVLANSRVAEARSHARVTTDAALPPPRLLLGPRREKAVDEQGFDDSIGMTLSIPLGGARQAALSRTSAEFAIAQAVSERDTQRRNLELNFHDAHHELEVTREQIELAGASLEFISRQADMAQIAYEQGESSLIELLRERRRLRNADAQLQQLTLTENLLIALYNQAVGVLP